MEQKKETTFGIATSVVTMRNSPIETSYSPKVLPKGMHFSILDEKDGWLSVRSDGRTGWIKASLASRAYLPAQSQTAIKVWEEPAMTLPVKRILEKGSKFFILSELGGWYNIRIGHQKGWYLRKALNLSIIPKSVMGLLLFEQVQGTIFLVLVFCRKVRLIFCWESALVGILFG